MGKLLGIWFSSQWGWGGFIYDFLKIYCSLVTTIGRRHRYFRKESFAWLYYVAFWKVSMYSEKLWNPFWVWVSLNKSGHGRVFAFRSCRLSEIRPVNGRKRSLFSKYGKVTFYNNCIFVIWSSLGLCGMVCVCNMLKLRLLPCQTHLEGEV